MHTTFDIKRAIWLSALSGWLLLVFASPPLLAQEEEEPVRVLVFSKTAGFRHSSIDEGIAMVQGLGAENGFEVDASEDAALFTDAGLAPYSAVIFLSTTGDFLNAEQQAAFERYIQAGGAFVGIHAASDAEYDWPWYEGLVGAYFQNHPAIQDALVVVEDNTHPSTAFLFENFTRRDEWYNFRSNPQNVVNVLLTVDESTYSGGGMGAFHPISWYHEYDGGRSWYTAMGHTEESFSEPVFRDHVLGGILWATGLAAGPTAVGLSSQAASSEPLLLNPMLWGGLAGLSLLTLLAWPSSARLRHLPGKHH